MLKEKKLISDNNNVIYIDFRRKCLIIPSQKQLEENLKELHCILQGLRLSRQTYSNKKLLEMTDELILEIEKELQMEKRNYIKLITKYLAIRREKKIQYLPAN